MTKKIHLKWQSLGLFMTSYSHRSCCFLAYSIVLIIIASLNSCAGPKFETSDIGAVLEQAQQESRETHGQNALIAPPQAVNELLLGRGQQTAMTSAQVRFNVSVNEVPARMFFLSLVADSGVNVVAHPEIEGTVSFDLNNVTVKEVLDVTRDVYGYEYKYERGIYTIFPRKLTTEVFTVDYLDVQRFGVTDTSVVIGQFRSDSDSESGNSNSNSNSSSGDDFSNGNSSGGNNDSSSVAGGARVRTLSETDFWSSLNEVIEAIVGADTGGRMVMSNPQSGLVVVKAMPRELKSVREYLKKAQLSVRRQVILETKILEVQLNEAYQTGINWSAISGSLSLDQANTIDGSLSDILFGGNSTQSSTISTVLNVVDITKLLLLLDQQGSVQVLSSPRISTVNNQKAVIRVGSDEFFVTGLSNSTTSSAASVVNTPEIELDSFFSGIALDVTPQISAEGDVILHVHPVVSSVRDQEKEVSFGGDSFSLPLALRDVRESDSIVRARSGQVVVLGGLMQENGSKNDARRPLFGDVPIIKSLFNAKQNSLTKTELVILMRPVVVGDETWERELSESVTRFNQLTQGARVRP